MTFNPSIGCRHGYAAPQYFFAEAVYQGCPSSIFGASLSFAFSISRISRQSPGDTHGRDRLSLSFAFFPPWRDCHAQPPSVSGIY